MTDKLTFAYEELKPFGELQKTTKDLSKELKGRDGDVHERMTILENTFKEAQLRTNQTLTEQGWTLGGLFDHMFALEAVAEEVCMPRTDID